ncbi:Uncharacterised protein [Bacillus tequilensis]|nr:Uncharacterised protein [Bacillus tequilensis]
MNDIFNDFFDYRVREYISNLNKKFENNAISADRYEFLFSKLMSWVDVYDENEENRNDSGLCSDY